MRGHRQQSGHELPGEARILGVEVISWPSETENEVALGRCRGINRRIPLKMVDFWPPPKGREF